MEQLALVRQGIDGVHASLIPALGGGAPRDHLNDWVSKVLHADGSKPLGRFPEQQAPRKVS